MNRLQTTLPLAPAAWMWPAVLLAVLLAPTAEAAVRLEAPFLDAEAGDRVSMSVLLVVDGGENVRGISSDLSFDPVAAPILDGGNGGPDCVVEDGISHFLAAFAFLPARCNAGAGGCTGVRVVIAGLELDGAAALGRPLYRCEIGVPLGTAPGIYPVEIESARYSRPSGIEAPVLISSGGVVVARDRIPTPTPTVFGPTPTRTGSPRPTAKVLGRSCTGDCDASGSVDGVETALLLRALFEPGALLSCDGSTETTDTRASAAHLVSALQAYVEGCAPATPGTIATPTPTSRPTASGTRTPPFVATPSLSPTPPPSPTRTRTATIMPTTTRTRRPTITRTATRTRAATMTRTPTRTGTGTPPPTDTPTRTATASRTPTPSATPTRTRTPTSHASPTRTRTETRTRTATITHTPTRTGTSTTTPTTTPSPTVTATAMPGPVLTYFGVASAGGTLSQPIGSSPQGIPIFERPLGFGFIVVVEGRPGDDNLPLGTSTFNYDPRDPSLLPDLQIVAGERLGRGSAAVCDNTGGVPAVSPPDFTPTLATSHAINDFGCRFIDGSGRPRGRLISSACVLHADGQYRFARAESQIQFCATMSRSMIFPKGDTLLTVRLRNSAGVSGGPSQIIVRTQS